MSDGATTSAPARACDNGHRDERLQRRVVHDPAALVEHAAVAVVGVRAQAHVRDHDEPVAEFLLQAFARALHRAVRGRGRAAVRRLAAVLGMAEQQHRADAELEVLARSSSTTVSTPCCAIPGIDEIG